MAFDRAAASAVLKDHYQPAIREQLNTNVFLTSQIQRTKKGVEGQEAVLALHTGRNSGVGARKENGTLPTAGQQAYTTARVPVKYNYGRLQVSGPVIESMKSDTGSYTRAIGSESRGLTNDLMRDRNRQLYTTSKGAIAAVTSGTSTTVFDVTDEAEARRLEPGMVVDIYSSAFVLQDSNAVIASVDVAATEVTVASALGGIPSAGDIIVRAGVVPTAVTSKATEDAQDEIHGLDDIISDSEWLHGIDPSATPLWKSYVVNAGAAPSDTVIGAAMDQAFLNSGEDVDLLIGSHKGATAFAATQVSQKRHTNTQTLNGGWEALTVQTGRKQLALYPERDCPDATMYGVATAHICQWVMADWQFMDLDGSVLHRIGNTDAYESTMFCYDEMGTDKRNAHFKITGLTV